MECRTNWIDMKKINLFGMMAVIVVAVECQATRYANEVVSYQPGVLPGNLKGSLILQRSWASRHARLPGRLAARWIHSIHHISIRS
jgi:hypothetical protein